MVFGHLAFTALDVVVARKVDIWPMSLRVDLFQFIKEGSRATTALKKDPVLQRP